MSDFTGALPTTPEPDDSDVLDSTPSEPADTFDDSTNTADLPALNEHGVPAAPKSTYSDVPEGL